ncbi:MAG: glycosyltransferase family 4 protein [Polyangiaceae bacterium]
MLPPNLHVAHVVRKLEPSAWGGTETHVAAVTSRMAAHGVSTSVYAPRSPGAAAGDIRVPIHWYDALTPYVGPAAARAALRSRSGNLISLDLPLKLMADRSLSIAHVHTAGRLAGAVRLAMRTRGLPYVLSVHGPLFADEKVVQDDMSRLGQGVIDVGQPFGLITGSRRVFDDATRVICFNEAERAALENRIGHRAVRMDHGVDTDAIRAGDADRAKQRWGWLRRGPVVMVVGRLCEQKNQVFAVRAFALGAPEDHQLVFVGAETDAGYREKIISEAWACGVADRVWFNGQVSKDQVADLLAAATLVMAPSVHEAFGISVIEGWAARVPVLVGLSSGTRDLVHRLGMNVTGIDGFDDRAWATRLGTLLAVSGLRAAIVEAGTRLVDRELSWAAVASKLRDLYVEVASENQANQWGARAR